MTSLEVTKLPSHPFEPCDGHAEPTTQALFSVGGLLFCGHCLRKAHGIEPTGSFLDNENKLQGSAN